MKEKIKNWFKDPYNIVFTILVLITIYFRFRFSIQRTIWVDETAYYLQSLYFLKTLSFGSFTPLTHMRIFPISIIIFFGLFFDLFIAGRLMALTFLITGLIFSYLIGKELKNKAIGIIAATLLAFNHQIWFHSSRTLTDVPLTAMFIVSTYFLIRLEKKYSLKNLIYLMIAVMLTIQTKFVGFLFVGVIALYYLIKVTFLIKITKKQKIMFGAGIIAVLTIAYFLSQLNYKDYKNLLFKEIIWALGAFTYQDYYLTQMEPMIGNIVLGLALAGLIFTIAYKKKGYLIISSWAIVVYAAFTFLPTGAYPRYILPAFPAVFFLAAIGTIELGHIIKTFVKINKNTLYAILIAIIFISVIPTYYQSAHILILKLSYFPYTGYDEAGEWIKNNVEDGAQVYVMSTSWANLFSENLHDRIKIGNTNKFKTPNQFIEELKNVNKPFYLIIDSWEAHAQPGWLTPTNQNIDYIKSLGFELKHYVNRKHPINDEQFMEVYNNIKLTTLYIDYKSLPETSAILILKKIQNGNNIENIK